MAALEITSEDHGDVRLLALAGSLDGRSVRELEQKLLESAGEGRRSLLIDCARLDLIDGAGLRMLVTVGQRLVAEGGGLALCALRPRVKRVFDMVRLPRRLSIHALRSEAQAWLEKSVRVARIARLASSLLRDSEIRQRKRYARSAPDADRLDLARRLLGLTETSA